LLQVCWWPDSATSRRSEVVARDIDRAHPVDERSRVPMVEEAEALRALHFSLQYVPEGPVEGRALLRRQFHARDGADPEPEAGRAEGGQKRVSVSDRCDRGSGNGIVVVLVPGSGAPCYGTGIPVRRSMRAVISRPLPSRLSSRTAR
jgi:hypothetical protein